ncbi:MAG: hypothetical protein DRH79_01415 [Candidatus Cloacimonadota bacterium]|nr:MAG: hypothetical protein DRH79_01415 [Candidatus Cloacimonadota bacterium]
MNINFKKSVSRNSFKLYILFVLMIFVAGLQAEQTNGRKQMFKSALIPGWGELSQDNKTGYIFLASELILWSSVFYFQQESDLKDTASRNYAIKYAHIDPELELTEDYLYDLRKHLSSGYETGGFNAGVVETAKAMFPDDLVKQDEYIGANVYSDEFYWEWDSRENKHDYAIFRKRMVQYSGYIKGITGGIIANHLVSALNSLIFAKKQNKVKMNVQFDTEMNPVLLVNYKF